MTLEEATTVRTRDNCSQGSMVQAGVLFVFAQLFHLLDAWRGFLYGLLCRPDFGPSLRCGDEPSPVFMEDFLVAKFKHSRGYAVDGPPQNLCNLEVCEAFRVLADELEHFALPPTQLGNNLKVAGSPRVFGRQAVLVQCC